MSIQNGNDFAWVYGRYLEWFRDNARPGAQPRAQETLPGFSLCHEDIFESPTDALNRMFFLVPLLPSESKSGRLEIFAITELNLLKKAEDDDEIQDIVPVEYSVQAFPK